jgi:hypothetical protein
VHLYTSVRAQAQDSWDFKSLSLRGADVGSGHSVGGGHSEAHDNPVDSGHPSTHPPLIPPLILHTILVQYFRWWKCENLTAQSEQYCAQAFVKSIGRCRYSLVSTAATVSTHFVIFLNPFIFLRCLRWTYTMPFYGGCILSYLTISKSSIRLLIFP